MFILVVRRGEASVAESACASEGVAVGLLSTTGSGTGGSTTCSGTGTGIWLAAGCNGLTISGVRVESTSCVVLSLERTDSPDDPTSCVEVCRASRSRRRASRSATWLSSCDFSCCSFSSAARSSRTSGESRTGESSVCVENWLCCGGGASAPARLLRSCWKVVDCESIKLRRSVSSPRSSAHCDFVWESFSIYKIRTNQLRLKVIICLIITVRLCESGSSCWRFSSDGFSGTERVWRSVWMEESGAGGAFWSFATVLFTIAICFREYT